MRVRLQYSIRSLLGCVAIAGVAFACVFPSIRAPQFVASFASQPDNRELRWLDASTRTAIHNGTKEVGLTTIGCANYSPVLEPITWRDVFQMRRRVTLHHFGAWDPIDRDVAMRHFLKLLDDPAKSAGSPHPDVTVVQTISGRAVSIEYMP
jgi:hypothetical protein